MVRPVADMERVSLPLDRPARTCRGRGHGDAVFGVSLGSLTSANNEPANLRTAYVASINPLTAAHVAMPK